jgi:response regulator RpfG family c-di-GMP phosphodiesterase
MDTEGRTHEVLCFYIDITAQVHLNREIIATQKEVISTMGAIGETRSKETGDHVKRVAEYSKLLALKHGLSLEEAEQIKMASPMHDIGKVGIADNILNKPGKLTDEEFEIMKTHAELGHEMLKGSQQQLLKTAAIISMEHHEKWDGSGYPKGLKGEEIHLYGRITAIADVFDALGHDRVYKKAWPLEKILDLFKEGRGKHFDPTLIDIFMNNLNDFLAIKESFDGNNEAHVEAL